MAAHQCPRCPLRFSFRTELELHLRDDHHDVPAAGNARKAGEPIPARVPLPTSGRAADVMAAAAVSSPSASSSPSSPLVPLVPLVPTRGSSEPFVSAGKAAVEPAVSEPFHDPVGRDGRPLPRPTLMPRSVVVTVTAIVIAVLGVGLLLAP